MTILTTTQLLAATGVTRSELQLYENERAMIPVKPGSSGTGHAATWTVMHALGLAYAHAVATLGFRTSWRLGAAHWLANQKQHALIKALKEGRTMVMLSLDGQGALVKPVPLKPTDDDAWKHRLEVLDLARVYRQTIARIIQVLEPHAATTCRECAETGNPENWNYCRNCRHPRPRPIAGAVLTSSIMGEGPQNPAAWIRGHAEDYADAVADLKADFNAIFPGEDFDECQAKALATNGHTTPRGKEPEPEKKAKARRQA
jgi:hypothetical protein